MTPGQARRNLVSIASALERTHRFHKSGRARQFGDRDDPEGTLYVRLSDSLARRVARFCRDLVEEIDQQ